MFVVMHALGFLWIGIPSRSCIMLMCVKDPDLTIVMWVLVACRSWDAGCNSEGVNRMVFEFKLECKCRWKSLEDVETILFPTSFTKRLHKCVHWAQGLGCTVWN